MLDLPPEDRLLSPATGWARAHWEAVADRMLAGVARYRSPRGGRVDLPGPPSRAGVVSDGLEGFARTFLLAATRAAGADDATARRVLDPYVEGLVSGPVGTPGEDPDAWPLVGTNAPGGQPMVESASVALGLLLARRRTWDRLDPAAQDRLEAWLRRSLRGDPAPNNWFFFPMTVASALEEVGRGDAETARAVERAHALAEGWYVGGGWYSDGDGRMFDHYVGWAMHLYPVLVAHLRGDDATLQRLGPRLAEFLETYTRTFDADGAPLHQGRSLTYRMAAVAPVALGALTGWTPLSPGQSRRVLSGALRYFLDRGALRDGVLTLGWHGPHRATLQEYSGPASPYWAAKGFLGLLLPPDADLWTAVEEDPPAAGPDAATPVGGVGWLVQTTQAEGLVRVHNHGSDHVGAGPDGGRPDPLYARLAYSTRTGPTSPRNTPDNHVRLVVRGRGSGRRRIHPLGSGPGWAASWHHPTFDAPDPTQPVSAGGGAALPQARVESVVLARGRWEVHVHRLHAVPDGTPVVVSGWALAGEAVEDVTAQDAGGGVLLRSGGTTAQLLPLHGWTGSRAVRAPAGTAYGAWALVGELTATTPSGLLVHVASLTGAPVEDGPPGVGVEPGRVVVTWADGRTSCELGAVGEGPHVSG